MKKVLIYIGIVLSWLCSGVADEWPQWLGPKRDAIWRETGIAASFPEDGPALRWRRPIGAGYSGPAVAAGKVVFMDRTTQVFQPDQQPEGNVNFARLEIPGNERIVCLNESDGSVAWVHEYPCSYTTAYPYAIGPRTTPTIEKDRVYALGAEGQLWCLDLNTGKVLWSKDFRIDYGLDVPDWGCAAHPLIDGDRLICVVGGRGTTAVAFNKHSGKEIWRALNSEEPGYCAPIIYEIHGRRQLIIWHGEAVNGLNPATGKVYWSAPQKPAYGMSIGIPTLTNQGIFCMGFNGFSSLVSINENDEAKLVWKGNTRQGVGGVLNKALYLDNHVYACGQRGQYRCIELTEGKRMWTSTAPAVRNLEDRTPYWANVFTVFHEPSKLCFLVNDIGDLIIASLSPQGYKEIDRAKVIEPTHTVGGKFVVWSHPAFANRSFYCRNDKEMLCYSLAFQGKEED